MLPKIDFITLESIQTGMDNVSDAFANNLLLKVNEVYYKIVEFEFYIHSEKDIHQDKYTHQHPDQLTFGKLYFHGSGMDITIGDGINFGGILIRGVVRIDNNKPTKSVFGPLMVVNEILSNLHFLTNTEYNDLRLVNMVDNYSQIKECFNGLVEFKMPRKNLGKNNNLNEDYYQFSYRIIHYYPFKDQLKIKIDGLTKLLADKIRDNTMTKKEAIQILGYNGFKDGL